MNEAPVFQWSGLMIGVTLDVLFIILPLLFFGLFHGVPRGQTFLMSWLAQNISIEPSLHPEYNDVKIAWDAGSALKILMK